MDHCHDRGQRSFLPFSVAMATETFFLTMLMVQIIIMQNLRFFRVIADFIKILEVSDFSIALCYVWQKLGLLLESWQTRNKEDGLKEILQED